ncbi:MAG TPA: dienelactone hydrolase family protein [Candidatus Binatia bacterium]|jgi:carboxymethylenebutenolidase|nr:dienelactone hydrolase family protein [Candidatus Binatia bacterium]
MGRLLATLTTCLVLAAGVARAAAPALPASEDTAKARLETSPRHGELVSVDVAGTAVKTWVVYPERKEKAPVVIVVHEIFGLTDWIRAVADQLAAEGFIAVVPDLLSGKGPGGGGTEAYPSRDDAVKAVSGLARDEVLSRLDAVRTWALKLPAANGRSASIGFCWGGGTSFAWGLRQAGLDAAVVYYGMSPEEPAGGKAPILGLYGGNDARVDATIEPAKAALGARYDPHVFDGAGHGFLRAQNGQDGANLRATEQAWPLTLAFLRKRTS